MMISNLNLIKRTRLSYPYLIKQTSGSFNIYYTKNYITKMYLTNDSIKDVWNQFVYELDSQQLGYRKG